MLRPSRLARTPFRSRLPLAFCTSSSIISMLTLPVASPAGSWMAGLGISWASSGIFRAFPSAASLAYCLAGSESTASLKLPPLAKVPSRLARIRCCRSSVLMVLFSRVSRMGTAASPPSCGMGKITAFKPGVCRLSTSISIGDGPPAAIWGASKEPSSRCWMYASTSTRVTLSLRVRDSRGPRGNLTSTASVEARSGLVAVAGTDDGPNFR